MVNLVVKFVCAICVSHATSYQLSSFHLLLVQILELYSPLRNEGHDLDFALPSRPSTSHAVAPRLMANIARAIGGSFRAA